MRISPVPALAACGLAALVPAAEAKPRLCTAPVIERTLIGAGRMTQDDFDNGIAVSLVRCGDVTGDGATDAVFALAGGGTAGNTRFGVIEGGADGAGELVLFRSGYKVGLARHDRRSFDVLQPQYRESDPNCCPSSFRETRYVWTGTTFKARKAKVRRTAPARFYRP